MREGRREEERSGLSTCARPVVSGVDPGRGEGGGAQVRRVQPTAGCPNTTRRHHDDRQAEGGVMVRSH